VRVVIGEDQALMREGLALILGQAGFDVIAATADATELVRVAKAERPDLVIADIRMPPGNTDDGLRAALHIRASAADVAVLVLSQHVAQSYARELIESGATGVGYLLKERVADVEAFVADARRVCEGGTVLDPEVVAAMIARPRRDDPIEKLTKRQREVLALMAEGRSNAAIAGQLVMSEKAVVKHISNIYDELELPVSPDDHRRVLAVVQFLTR
jgi:DNA-binding NarL/FixJ family response regulator